MNSDAKVGIFASESYGVIEGRTGNHQARAGKNAFLVCANDRYVDFFRDAKVVRVNDQASMGQRLFHRLHLLTSTRRLLAGSGLDSPCLCASALLSPRQGQRL